MYHYISCTVLFVLLLSSVTAQSCGVNGLEEVGLCVCYSGFAPSGNTAQDCDTAADSSCLPWLTASSTTTVGAASLNSDVTSFGSNALTIAVQSPFVTGRTLTEISVGGSTDPQCTYPSISNIFHKSLLTCDDTFTGIIPWSANAACNFVEDTTDPDFIRYKAPIYVTNTNVLSSLRGQVVEQNTTDVLQILVQFPTQISISTNTEVVAPVNMFSAVLDQSYAPGTQTATISFATSLQWPFQVTAGVVGTLPTGFTVSTPLAETTPLGSCGNTVNSSCYQTFTLKVAPGVACQLTGSYPITFTLVCRNPQDACPLDTSTNSAALTLSLTSADFCATLTIGVTVNAALASYQDAALTIQKAAFLIDQTAHFLVTTSSAQATVSATEVVSIAVTSGTTSTTIYTSVGGVSNAAILANVATPTGSTATFDIDFTADFFTVPVDQDLTYGFTVEVQVTFAGNAKKRFSLAVQPTANSAATSKVTLQPASSTTRASNAVATCAGLALTGSLLFLSLIM